ncbi:murein transglycosylase domain-containing protein [Marinobacter sp. S6332]|uniref:transglycosylase SLT domain-containing protein n=1 Tax=Marinobacter sp. S6332 TaxID=2926403 RepID=UPI001FF11087|nr:murein transglycosylase domain-containing protein [Marinobacter sp. S6332]
MIPFRSALSALALSLPLLVAGQQSYGAGNDTSASWKNSAKDFSEYKAKRMKAFNSYKRSVQEEFAEFSGLHDRVSEAYTGRISEIWKDPETSSQTRWVHYQEGYQLKRVVDFEKKQIIWSTPESLASSSTLSRASAREMLANLLVMTRQDAFDQDEVAQEVEEESRRNFRHLETDSIDDSDQLLSGFIFGESNVSEAKLNMAVDAMMAAGEKSTVKQNGQSVIAWVFPITSGKSLEKPKQRPVETVSPPQIAAEKRARAVLQSRPIGPDSQQSLPAQARPFLKAINKQHREFDLSAELLLAIIETESAFNPMAKSPIPAFGLMQIVPQSAGQDATEKIFGEPRILAPSYLYNADNNIRIGAAYFHILYYQYFRGIENPLSRLYCSIAAYNTGPGNVSAALTGAEMRLTPAIAIANGMSPEQVYTHLLKNLPYEETVNYLRKVTGRLSQYEQLLSSKTDS